MASREAGWTDMIAYKFLHRGRRGPFSQFRWPQPGTWVRAASDTAVCRRGIHACRIVDLPWWLADELWEVELEGELIAHEHKLVAPAARLGSRIGGWTAECAHEFFEACAWRGRDRAVEALHRAGHAEAAAHLAACTTLDTLLAGTRRMIGEIPEVRINLTMAGDGAERALSGAPPATAYIVAHAAHRLDGLAGYVTERAWQAQ
ncbi:MAG TPA: hypothetical protein VIX82_01925, partial [Solirubrobacteraceae bacterium]